MGARTVISAYADEDIPAIVWSFRAEGSRVCILPFEEMYVGARTVSFAYDDEANPDDAWASTGEGLKVCRLGEAAPVGIPSGDFIDFGGRS